MIVVNKTIEMTSNGYPKLCVEFMVDGGSPRDALDFFTIGEQVAPIQLTEVKPSSMPPEFYDHMVACDFESDPIGLFEDYARHVEMELGEEEEDY